MKLLRKLLLKSSRIRQAVADYQRRMREEARKDHLISVLFRGGKMRL